MVKFIPEKLSTPEFNELYWYNTLPFWVRYAPAIELSDKTPTLWKLTDETVTAPALPAVKFTARTGTRAAPRPLPEDEIKDPETGLLDARLTAIPVAGATTEVLVVVPVVVVVEHD